MTKTTNQQQIVKGKWRVYNRTRRRFKVVVDYIWTDEVENKYCFYDQLNEVIQKFY